ncbi:MAG: hypothetical protein AAFQ20_09830 [Bacteroidota bacterium]
MRTIRVALYLTFFSLFLFACESDEDEMETDNPNEVGFNINVSGDFSRNMQGTNATFAFQELPSLATTTHQLSIYLTDSEGYTVTAIIKVNGTSTPPPGTYPALNLTANGFNGDDPGTVTFLFGKDGGISHTSNLQGQGGLSILTTREGLLSGSLETPLVPSGTGSGNISVSGTFTAEPSP